jgi:uncharacterized protein YbjT (DUF2867 family)
LSTNEAMSPEPLVILLTGATGYIGGRLLRLLEKQGYRVRGLARRPEVLRQKADASTEVSRVTSLIAQASTPRCAGLMPSTI